MNSSVDVTSDTHSSSDNGSNSDSALDTGADAAVTATANVKVAQSILACGQAAAFDGIARIGLAPKPINSGREPLCISPFLSKKNRQFIEFSFVSSNVHAAQMMIWVQLTGLCMILYGVLTFGFLFLPLTLPPLIGFSIWFWLIQQDIVGEASSMLPLRFHGQRQEVMLSYTKRNKPVPKRPSLIGSDRSIFLAFSAYMLLGLGSGFVFMEFGTSVDYWGVISGLILFFIGLVPLYKLAKPWRQYFKDKKGLVVSEELLPVPWEEVAVEYQSSQMTSLFTATNIQFLVLSAPDPKNPGQSIAAVSIPVHSQEEAFCLYEFIRQYMDGYKDSKGQDNAALAAVKITEPEYNRAGYKRFLQKRWQQNPVSYPLWRIWYWLTLRYLAHLMLEYHHDIMPAKVQAREDVQDWSAELPETEWKTSSAALKTLNQEVESLYQQGHQWESEPVQAILAKHRQIQSAESMTMDKSAE